MKEILLVITIVCLSPFFVYFCVKFGTIAYYKAKEFVEKEDKCQNFLLIKGVSNVKKKEKEKKQECSRSNKEA